MTSVRLLRKPILFQMQCFSLTRHGNSKELNGFVLSNLKSNNKVTPRHKLTKIDIQMNDISKVKVKNS